ncbi:cytosolic sulfotransferase 15-like [Humulus lupulus]|uniref:cytosolic sulfotransferase 15-like n=1 Tax=Humulus lupulus TaxID=3486 RepID=UPI002B407A84|nr:cytosolic sulfotransferase 15-like [Humulus lupulus]
MEISNVTKKNKDEEMERDETVDETLAKLEKVKDPVRDIYRCCYQGFWTPTSSLKSIISFQTQFEARDDDILLASCPKSGTTWLKSLVFAIVRRSIDFELYSNNSSLFSTTNVHDLIPFEVNREFTSIIENMKPRLLSTHIPYPSLPPSIKYSNCKIVYICRHPLDVFISYWHFNHKFVGDNVEPHHLEECFNMFCEGIHPFGPFWDHILGFWKESLESPHKILFLKYEDLKRDNAFFIKKIADFLGYPFSTEEENQGVPQQTMQLCSFENLKNLDVNKTGRRQIGLSNSALFRKGEVGDWVNYLTPEMAERGKKLIQEKLGQSNLMFDF